MTDEARDRLAAKAYNVNPGTSAADARLVVNLDDALAALPVATDEGLRDDFRALADAARTLLEVLDREGIGNLALFEQQVNHLRGHLPSDAAGCPTA